MDARKHWQDEITAQIEAIREDFAARKAAGATPDQLRVLVDQKKKLVEQFTVLKDGGDKEAYALIEKLQQQASNARMAQIKEKTAEIKSAPHQARMESQQATRAAKEAQRAAEAAVRSAERDQKLAANAAKRDEAKEVREAQREIKLAASDALRAANKEAREAQRAQAELERRQKEDTSHKKASPSDAAKSKLPPPVTAATVEDRVKSAAERSQKIANDAATLASGERKGFGKKGI